MVINKDTIKGKWREIKGEVQKAWGRLTDDELEASKGDYNSIAGLIQQKYGDKKEKYEDKLSQIFNKFKQDKDEYVDKTKRNIKDSNEDV